MKLYTKEQVRNRLNIFLLEPTTNKILESLTPIELPSDEKINEKAKDNSAWEYNHETNFKLGARWMKEQILNQNINRNIIK